MSEGPANIWNRNFILMLAANCLIVHSYLMLSPTFPMYLEELGHSQDMLGLLTGVFVVTAMISRPFAGKILDAGHRKNTFLFGQLVSMTAIVLYPFAHAAVPILLLRLLHGIGIGITTTAANTIAAAFIPRRRMSEGIGYFGLSMVVYMGIAPGLGIYLSQHWNAHVLFMSAASLAAASAIIGILVRYDKRQPPVAIFSAFRGKLNLIERGAVMPAAVGYFSGMSFGVITSYIALYAAERNVDHIGLFFTVYALTLILSRPGAGMLADRKGFAYAVIPGLLLIIVSLLLLAYAQHLALFLAAAVIFGVGSGGTQSTLQAMSIHQSPLDRRGSAVSTFYLGLDLAAGLGPFLGGIAAAYAGYDRMYLLTTISVAIGLTLFVWDVRKKRFDKQGRVSA